MLGRTGATSFQIRYDDEQDPLVWVAVGEWAAKRLPPADPTATGTVHECAAGMDPLRTVLRLLDQVIDGGTCVHCGKPTGVSDDFANPMPLPDVICWYIFDPELATFRRGCEGDTPRVGRNDPCPCGSGVKYKRCHGS